MSTTVAEATGEMSPDDARYWEAVQDGIPVDVDDEEPSGGLVDIIDAEIVEEGSGPR